MTKLELRIVHSRNGKQELLDNIDLAISLAPKPTPLPQYACVTGIKWPKVKKGRITGLLSDHGLIRDYNGRWACTVDDHIFGNKYASLKQAKGQLEALLLGTISGEDDDFVIFTSDENGTEFEIINDVFHLQNFREVVRKSTKTYFHRNK